MDKAKRAAICRKIRKSTMLGSYWDFDLGSRIMFFENPKDETKVFVIRRNSFKAEHPSMGERSKFAKWEGTFDR